MAKNYTSKTASLKAVTIDVHKLESNIIKVNGQDLEQSISSTKSDILNQLDIVKQDLLYEIDNATPTVKISTDTRQTITENDLWGTYVETKDNGEIVIHDDWFNNPNLNSKTAWNTQITSVTNNKAYGTNNNFFANVQTEKIKNGSFMFYKCSALTSFTSDLSSLTEGHSMFHNCYSIQSFYENLSSLSNGDCMFASCSSLVKFTSDLPQLTNASHMFYNCSALDDFSVDVSSLVSSNNMFHCCSSIT